MVFSSPPHSRRASPHSVREAEEISLRRHGIGVNRRWLVGKLALPPCPDVGKRKILRKEDGNKKTKKELKAPGAKPAPGTPASGTRVGYLPVFLLHDNPPPDSRLPPIRNPAGLHPYL